MSPKMSYTIIGNSVSAISAIEAIRSIDHRSQITLISDEIYHTYSRPLISYYLAGKVDDSKMYYRPLDFYERKGVRTLLGKKVLKVDTSSRKLVLGDEELPFEKLLIATGASPSIPPIDGLDRTRFFTFTKWDDAKAILEELNGKKNPVVLGAGLIGVKAAEALNLRGFRVTMVELAKTILPNALDKKASCIMEKAARDAGIEVITENTIVEVHSKKGEPQTLTLKDGRMLPCDLLIIAVGVRPNIQLVEGTQIEVGRGIKVDQFMQTNIKGIYSSGDVSEARELLKDESEPVPIWPNGYAQGKTAGKNMAGESRPFRGSVNMNSVEINHIPVISVGLSNIEGDDLEILLREDTRKNYYRKIVLKDDRIVGAILVNCIDRAGIITSLIIDRIDVSNFKDALLEDSFGYLSLPKHMRRRKLEKLGFLLS